MWTYSWAHIQFKIKHIFHKSIFSGRPIRTMLKHSMSSLNVLPLPLYFLMDDENKLQRHVKNDPYIDFAL